MSMLLKVKPKELLSELVLSKNPLRITYQKDGGWFVKRAVLSDVEDNSFEVRILAQLKSRVLDLEAGCRVGVSFEYGLGVLAGKFIFDTTVDGLISEQGSVGMLVRLAIPENIELVSRRNYRRVQVPALQNVNVLLWQRFTVQNGDSSSVGCGPELCAKLLDISLGGLQIAMETSESIVFEEGQSVGLRFTPFDHETPISFTAMIRTVLPTANRRHLTLGLEIIGLEASPEGRLILSRLASVVEQYDKLNNNKR